MGSQANQRLFQLAASSSGGSTANTFSTQFTVSAAGTVSLADPLTVQDLNSSSITASGDITGNTLASESGVIGSFSLQTLTTTPAKNQILYVSGIDSNSKAIIGTKASSNTYSIELTELCLYLGDGTLAVDALNSNDYSSPVTGEKRPLSIQLTTIGELKTITMGVPQMFNLEGEGTDFGAASASFLSYAPIAGGNTPIPIPSAYVPSVMKENKSLDAYTVQLGTSGINIIEQNIAPSSNPSASAPVTDGVIAWPTPAANIFVTKSRLSFGLYFQKGGSISSPTYTVSPRIYKDSINIVSQNIATVNTGYGVDIRVPNSISGFNNMPQAGIFYDLVSDDGTEKLYCSWAYSLATANTPEQPTTSGEEVSKYGYYSHTFMYL